MTAVATQTRIAPEELERMPDANNFELVDGDLVGRHVSILSSEVATNASTLFKVEAKRTKLACVFGNDLGYPCYPHNPGQDS